MTKTHKRRCIYLWYCSSNFADANDQNDTGEEEDEEYDPKGEMDDFHLLPSHS